MDHGHQVRVNLERMGLRDMGAGGNYGWDWDGPVASCSLLWRDLWVKAERN